LPEPRSSSITYEPSTMDAALVLDDDHEIDHEWIDLARDAIEPDEVVASAAPTADADDPAAVAAAGDDDDLDFDPAAAFPIADYDHLWSTQIVPLLAELDASELAMVEARERGGRHRLGVIEAVRDQRQLRQLSTGGTKTIDPVSDEPSTDDTPSPHQSEPRPLPAPIDLRPFDDSPDPEPSDGATTSPMAEVVGDHEEPDPAQARPSAPDDGSPRVRTFLGHRRSPLTIDLD
jgi:hypothetical protein